MRGTIVVPDTLEVVIDFSPGLAHHCERLSEERYLHARAKDGLTVERSILGMLEQIEWCWAALSEQPLPDPRPRPLPQRGLEKTMKQWCDRLAKVARKYRSAPSQERFLPLPNPEYAGQVGFRAGCVIEAAVLVYQVYQFHLRRAVYTFDRESGVLFPGGSRDHVKHYQATLFSKLLPVAQPRKGS